jgi:hypothetical protein
VRRVVHVQLFRAAWLCAVDGNRLKRGRSPFEFLNDLLDARRSGPPPLVSLSANGVSQSSHVAAPATDADLRSIEKGSLPGCLMPPAPVVWWGANSHDIQARYVG